MRFPFVLATALLISTASCNAFNTPKHEAEIQEVELREMKSPSSTDTDSIASGSNGMLGNMEDQQPPAAPPPGQKEGTPQQGSSQQVQTPKREKDPSVVLQPTPAAPTAIDWSKKLIKNATLSIETPNEKTFAVQVSAAVERAGGYISSQQRSENGGRTQTQMVIKVPVDRFDATVRDLTTGTNGQKVVDMNISTEDVTRDYVDARARMNSKEAIRLRYVALLGSAKTMSDVLEIQGKIDEIQEELEAVGGRAQYLRQAAAYSTINLSYTGVGATKTEGGFLQRLKSSIASGGEWLGHIFILVISLWPLWVVAAIVYFLYRRRKI